MINVPDVLHLFPGLNDSLMKLLRNLTPGQWQLQTVARLWKVKDVAAHLLDGNLRRIALHRDGWTHTPDAPVRPGQDLVGYLNSLNADWVKSAQRLSPQIIVDMLDYSNPIVYKLFSTLDPNGPAVFPVGWAGEATSLNSFDIAREYTERWLHQQQVRDALDDEYLLSAEYYKPALDIFMQAWPFVLNASEADPGTVLKTTITGQGGGVWLATRDDTKWVLSSHNGDTAAQIAGEITIDGAVAWKLFSKSVRRSEIEGRFEVSGNSELAEKVLEMISVMA